jgi:peptide deformylase
LDWPPTTLRAPSKSGIAATAAIVWSAAGIAATGVAAAAGNDSDRHDRTAGASRAGCLFSARLTRQGLALKSPRMALRDIIILPDKRLRQVSDPVKTVDAEVRALVNDMFETMYEAPGVGLAAIQVGEPRRIITADTAKKDEEKQPQVFINPEIVWSSEERNTYEEGCLSIPEYYEEVERPAQVKVKFTDLDGKAHEIEANGLLATVLQHEIDHLNGVLFIDHISKLKRDRVIKKFAKAAKREAE